MAADAERVEKAATTCVVIHKKGIYSMILKKKKKSLSAVRYVRYCPVFPIQCFISKNLKNWNLKTSFGVLTFITPLEIQLHTLVKQKYQPGSEATARYSEVSALKLLHNRPGD